MSNAHQQLWSFAGGIHPPANKQQSLQGLIRNAPVPPQLCVPVTQPDYAELALQVQVGQRVSKGQVLATAAVGIGITAHAPVGGVVSAIGEYAVPNASGLPEHCVVIDTDTTDSSWLKLPPLDYQQCDSETLIRRSEDAGLVGLGGAGFPTHAKLRSALAQVHTVILNAAECEPFITADEALLREHAAEVCLGGLMLLQLTGAARCLIGIEDNKPLALAELQRSYRDSRLQVVVIPACYPSGGVKQLIQILTGTEIPSGTLEIDSGFLCHNVGTAYALARAVQHGEQLLSRITTVTGAALQQPGNFDALLGTPLAFLLEQCGVDSSVLSQLIGGGPLMGIGLPHADLPVTKTTNCLLATTVDELPPPAPEQMCIRCGFCADVCPARLLPQELLWHARSGELERAEQYHLQDCIECGACAYVCPSHIPLVQYYRAAKADIAVEQDKRQRAAHSKLRFDAHQQRMAEEKRQEEQRRAARAELARQKADTSSKPTSAADAVAAALARVKAKKAAAAPANLPPESEDKA